MPGQVPKTAQKSQTQTRLLNRGWGKLRDIENWIALWNSAGDPNGFEGEGTWRGKGARDFIGLADARRSGPDPFA